VPEHTVGDREANTKSGQPPQLREPEPAVAAAQLDERAAQVPAAGPEAGVRPVAMFRWAYM
jgi:hypothetical protein